MPAPILTSMLHGSDVGVWCEQGSLAERLRAGGAGIPAFYTPTAYGTLVQVRALCPAPRAPAGTLGVGKSESCDRQTHRLAHVASLLAMLLLRVWVS